jgi:hypothetical protein
LFTLDVEFDFLGNNVIRKIVKLNLRYEMNENKLTVCFHASLKVSLRAQM